MPNIEAKDPWLSYKFGIEIQGIQEAVFEECSGISVEVKAEPYEEGGLNGFTHKIPGRRSYSNVTLKRPISASTKLLDWLDRTGTAAAKSDELRNMSILIMDSGGEVMRRYNLFGAFPVKWTGPTLNTTTSTALVETLEIAFQEMTTA